MQDGVTKNQVVSQVGKIFVTFSFLAMVAVFPTLLFIIQYTNLAYHKQTHASAIKPFRRGVNLFGGWQGLYSGTDTFANPQMLDYLKSKNLNTFRVGFAWEHLQPSLQGPLDQAYLAMMDTLVANAKSRGQQVAFVPLPGTYKGNVLGSNFVSQKSFNNLWIQLASHYKNEPAIWGYDLLNEPDIGDAWNTTIAPSTIAAIRSVDTTHAIIVPTATGGYGHYFTSHLVGLPMKDSANNLIYEAHFYFDTPPNGEYLKGFDVPNGNLNIGIDHAKGFVDWCTTNNQQCYAGEYGVPGGWTSGDQACNYGNENNQDARWLTVLDNFLTYLDQNNISGTYWSAGPYGDSNSVGPFCNSNGQYRDAPQMLILEKHLVSPTTISLPSSTPKISSTIVLTPIPSIQIAVPKSTVLPSSSLPITQPLASPALHTKITTVPQILEQKTPSPIPSHSLFTPLIDEKVHTSLLQKNSSILEKANNALQLNTALLAIGISSLVASFLTPLYYFRNNCKKLISLVLSKMPLPKK